MFPPAVPEIPATNVDTAISYYVNALGFTHDWGDDAGGIAGLSRENCRVFVTNGAFRASYSHGEHGQHRSREATLVFWLNLDSKDEVNRLFTEWKASGAMIVAAPEDKPWKLREFLATDPDGNLIRVFYDFSRDV